MVAYAGRAFKFWDGPKRMAQAVDKERLFELLEPAVEAMGFELVDLDAHLGRRGLLRLFVDREGGVTLDDCQRVSEQIGALLDVEDPLPGSYVLEVDGELQRLPFGEIAVARLAP